MPETSRTVRPVRRFGRFIKGLALTILLLATVNQVATPIVLAQSAGADLKQVYEYKDNQAVLTQYMHTFQMDDWHIQLVMVDKKFLDNVMKNKNSVAASQINPNTKYGVVWLLKRSEYTPEMFKSFGMNEQDEEWIVVDQRNSVVHELIHAVWRYCVSEEVCVAMLAEAAVPHEDTK